MGGAISNVSKNALKGLNLSATMGQAVQALAVSGDQRAQFNAILMATVATVTKKPNFNLELEINDLWIRLGNLRTTGAATPHPSMVQLSAAMQAMLGNLDDAMKNLTKGLK